MAENFASLEYKTLEEVLNVIKSLTATLSTTGLEIVGWLSSSNLDGEMLASSLPRLRVSVIVTIVMQLKTHLKGLYSLSEE